MLTTYIEQVRLAAAEKGFTIKEVCVAEGLHASTLWRWQNPEPGKEKPAEMTQESAEALMQRIKTMRRKPKVNGK